MNLLELRGLSKSYGPVMALRDFTLTVAAGSSTSIVGPSASGKTTLLRLIAGFETPDAGEIRIGGHLVANSREGVPAHLRNIGLVMQDGALFPHLTVFQNIAFGLARGTDDVAGKVHAMMEVVDLVRPVAARFPHELSGGQQQRVALARALMRKPRLMLLDEPFSALDAGLRDQTREAVAKILSQAGITTILVTHDQTEAMSFADQIVVLREGRLRQAGPPKDVYLSPVDAETAAFLGQAIVLDAEVTGGIAACCLGLLPADTERIGPARIMLRPEQIRLLAPDPSGPRPDTVRGQILASDFAGPNATVTLALVAAGADAGKPLRFRTQALGLPAVGSAVEIYVQGAVHVLDNAGPSAYTFPA